MTAFQHFLYAFVSGHTLLAKATDGAGFNKGNIWRTSPCNEVRASSKDRCGKCSSTTLAKAWAWSQSRDFFSGSREARPESHACAKQTHADQVPHGHRPTIFVDGHRIQLTRVVEQVDVPRHKRNRSWANALPVWKEANKASVSADLAPKDFPLPRRSRSLNRYSLPRMLFHRIPYT